MITAFKIENNRFELTTGTASLVDAIWIHLINPTPVEIEAVEKTTGVSLPNVEDTEELEASSHYEVYPTGFHINCSFLPKIEGLYSIINVAFLCNVKCLISLSKCEIPAVSFLQKEWQKTPKQNSDPASILIALHEIKIDKLADLSEGAYLSLEKIRHQIFDRVNADLEETIDDLSWQDDLNGKIRLCLMDGQRDLNFLLRRGNLSQENASSSNDMQEDIKTLLTHNTFLSERIDFLLNAALGFINIEQNKIIKIFSIAAVVLMPPTVIASIYGMNFHFMPELSWQWGYPLSLLIMLLAGISPYLYFKRKGWL